MIKLTDTQLIVLSSAAKHDEGLATRPLNLHAAAAHKVATSLISKGLAREIRAKTDAPVWQENDDGRFALKITKAGREAIGVDDEEAEGAIPPPITPAVSKAKNGSTNPDSDKDTSQAPAGTRKHTGAKAAGNADPSSGQIRRGSKQAAIVDLMVRPKGATLEELIGATDWLPHTTRAALTGLRKRGYAIERIRGADKITRYRATPLQGSAAEPKQEPTPRSAKARLAKAA